MKKSLWLMLGVVATFGFATSCEKAEQDLTALTAQEIEDLGFLREEEKLAHDVYVYAFEKYGLDIFNNISESEAKHTSSVLNLLNQYNLPDPVGENAAGVFQNETLQSIYDNLVATVDLSLTDALKVGATIEDLDINDLNVLTTHTTNPDLLNVYSKLTCGSENHIRSFVGQLNGDYAPQYISVAEYETILSETSGHCGN